MITREQVADLREGDVVELGFASGAIIRGPLVEHRHTGELEIPDAGWTVRDRDGAPAYGLERYAETLTVISRAPRPLYVNHPRTEAVPGDVLQPEFAQWPIWVVQEHGRFCENKGTASVIWRGRGELPERLRLLVDGETGQVVP